MISALDDEDSALIHKPLDFTVTAISGIVSLRYQKVQNQKFVSIYIWFGSKNQKLVSDAGSMIAGRKSEKAFLLLIRL